MKRAIVSCVAACVPAALWAAAADSNVVALVPAKHEQTGRIDPSTATEAEAAILSGLDWLAACQRDDGSWSDTNYPALTALPTWAFARSGHTRRDEIVGKSTKYLLALVQPDGGIYRKLSDRKGGGLSCYNTAISMIALNATGNPDVVPVVQKAREFVAASQYLGDDMYRGGFGYDWATDRKYSDLMNSVWAMEAMRFTEGVEAARTNSDAKADLDWQAAQAFLTRLQENADRDGGFPYRPDESKAGNITNTSGGVTLRSYGSMTYAGLLGMLYARLDRADPRVKTAHAWATEHWTLDENPGMGTQGLYWFYHIITKALAAYGEDTFKSGDKTVTWRAEVVTKILAAKKTDEQGRVYWLNENGRFMESDKVLVTAYTILALQIATGL